MNQQPSPSQRTPSFLIDLSGIAAASAVPEPIAEEEHVEVRDGMLVASSREPTKKMFVIQPPR